MPVVQDTVTLPDGTPAKYGTATIYLVASDTSASAPGFDLTANETIISKQAVNLNRTTGALSVTLTPNDDITPAGTVYKIVYQAKPGTSPADPIYIEVPDGAGPYEVGDILTEAPASLTSAPLALEIAAREAAVDDLTLAIGTKVSKAGDTMTGPLVLPGDAAAALQATPLQQVQALVAALVDAAPGALDTLNELAAALGDDANFAATVTTALAGKVPLTGGTMTGDLIVPDEAYDATAWNGSAEVPTKNAVRDKFESSGVIAYNAYNPGTQVQYTTSSTTPADVDATNMKVTFVAPASGKVKVFLAAQAVVAATTSLTWGLRSGTTDLESRAAVYDNYDGRLSATFVITGLTAGQSYTYKWSYSRSTGSATSAIRVGGTAGQAGVAYMEVVALP